MKAFILILTGVVMTLILYHAATQVEAENTIKPPPVEAPATTAREEIVTGLCTFGDCQVATAATSTLPPTTEPETITEPVSDTCTFTEWDDDWSPDYSATYTANEFCVLGEIYWNGWRWTWYSELVLPGTGLNIPGRHTEGGYVRDGDGYICLASDALDRGTVIETPFGAYGRVYDCGCDYDTIDVYVSW